MKYLSFFTISLFVLVSSNQCQAFTEEPLDLQGIEMTTPGSFATLPPPTPRSTDATAVTIDDREDHSAIEPRPIPVDLEVSAPSVAEQVAEETDSPKSPIYQVWLGRAFRIFGKPLMAVGTGLAFEASTSSNPALAMGGGTIAAAGALIDRIGEKVEIRGIRNAAEIEMARKQIVGPLTPAENRSNADSFLAKDASFRSCTQISAEIYNFAGTCCSLLGLPLAISGGIVYTYGHNTNNDYLTNIGIGLGTSGIALHTLGSELGKLAKEREEDLARFAERDKVRATLSTAAIREPA